MTEQMIPNYAHEGTDTPEMDALALRMALELGGPEVFLRQSLALRDRPAQIETLAAYTGPPSLVLVGGESDKLCPLDRHEQMHGLLVNSVLEVIEKAGHLTTLEQPETTNAALARWLEA